MRVSVDSELCSGHGRCYVICPEVFDEDDEGHCVIARTEVSEAQQAAAQRAVENCPERAISISDLG